MMADLGSTYGSDQYGLIWGYRFAPGQAATSITSEAAMEFLTADSVTSRDFLWLHFSLANAACKPWFRQHLTLPDPFYESLQGDSGSTRLEQGANFLVALIHDVHFDFKFDASAISTTSLFIGPRLLLSARLRPLRSVDQLRQAVRAGDVFRSPVDLLAHLLRDQANVLADIVRQSTVRVDQIEDRILAARVSASRRELSSLRRVLVRLQRLLAPEPAALFRLLNRPPEWIASDDVRDLQQTAEEFSAAVGDSGTLVERVKLLQEELADQVSERTGRTLFVLTVVTVLALPINLVASLFGMNVGGIPLANSGYGFITILALLVALTLILVRKARGSRRELWDDSDRI
jgi:zinc transporter